MPVTIENRTDSRVLLRFNSGTTWHLGPHEVLEVENVEVKGNAGIQRLEERSLISVRSGDETARAEAPAEESEPDAQPRARRGKAPQ